jgi:hypothetical protein
MYDLVASATVAKMMVPKSMALAMVDTDATDAASLFEGPMMKFTAKKKSRHEENLRQDPLN